MSRNSVVLLFTMVVLVIWSVGAIADDVVGAKSALEKIRKSVDRVKAEAEKKKEAQPANEVQAALKEFRAKRDTLPAGDAASRWLKLYDAWIKSQVAADDEPIEFRELVNALPRPEAWGELSRQIQKRKLSDGDLAQVRDRALRMLAFRLNGRFELLSGEISAVGKLLAPAGADAAPAIVDVFPGGGPDWERHQLVEALQELEANYDPNARLANFVKQIEREGENYVSVPDLVKLAGRERASKLLAKALVQAELQLEFSDSEETLNLARQVARKHLGDIPTPRWELCEAIGTADLYEAFAKLPDEDSHERWPATAWYVINLIVDGRSDELVEFLNKQPRAEWEEHNPLIHLLEYKLIDVLDRGGHTKKVYAFLVGALKKSPDLPLWEPFVSIAARLGHSDRMLAMVDEALKSDKLTDKLKLELRKIRGDALLAADRVEDGVQQYFNILDEASDETDLQTRFDIAIRLADIGRLLENKSWIDKGLGAAFAAVKASDESDEDLSVDELAGLLNELGQHGRAEQLLIDRIAKQLAQGEMEHAHFIHFGESPIQTLLEELLATYHHSGRHAEVVALLEQAPWWGKRDLAQLLTPSRYRSIRNQHGGRPQIPTGYIAAKALAEVGRRDEARRKCEVLLSELPGYDPVWQLALELTGDDFERLAEDIFRRDRFEERPLIWRAQFELNRDNTKRAGELIGQAISIDPSDGEQGRSHRMRAYTILSDVLRKQGDKEKADLFAGAIRAIRLAERADQFYRVGLLARGIKMYRDSLRHFDDAYCIQSRLATQFAMRGDIESAAKHYERAFELMPSSFGRVESHCFGCEGVFQGQLAQDIAARVFQKLAEKSPDDPRVQYLLGYLNYEREQYSKALKPLSEAVRLDKDYLNAWKQLLALGEHIKLAPGQSEAAVLNIVRLDPLGQRSHPDVSQIRDLAKLWRAVESKRELSAPKKPKTLMALKASAEQISKMENTVDFGFESFSQGRDDQVAEFASHRDLSAIAKLIENVD